MNFQTYLNGYEKYALSRNKDFVVEVIRRQAKVNDFTNNKQEEIKQIGHR